MSSPDLSEVSESLSVRQKSDLPSTESHRPSLTPLRSGDKVVLNLGGPVMTVQEIRPMAICEWATDKGVESTEFPPECLKRTGGS